VESERFAPDARPASTVLVLRDGPSGPEVFMVRRHADTAFMGGAHVFPGGRVDAADRDVDDSWCDGLGHARAQLAALPPLDAAAYHVAAARELFEEAGVLLARNEAGEFVSLTGAAVHVRFAHDREAVHSGETTMRAVLEREHLRLALDVLVLFAHWVTPPVDKRQFDTRFFMTRVPPHQTPVHDDTETTHSCWIRPAEALAQSQRGEILLPPPTWTTLRELEPFETVDDTLAWARKRTIIRRLPRHLDHDGVRTLVLPGDELHPDPAPLDPRVETRFVFADGRWRAQRSRT
jgi:8-oxo-dGTP pyrophosphatase MutT (NUDIX family)